MVNKELLLEDIKFPIKTEHNYCWDATGQYNVCNLLHKDSYYKIDGEYKDEGTQNVRFAYEDGNFIHIESGKKIGMVRGWGTLQYKDHAEERQDNIGQYLVRCLNRVGDVRIYRREDTQHITKMEGKGFHAIHVKRFKDMYNEKDFEGIAYIKSFDGYDEAMKWFGTQGATAFGKILE